MAEDRPASGSMMPPPPKPTAPSTSSALCSDNAPQPLTSREVIVTMILRSLELRFGATDIDDLVTPTFDRLKHHEIIKVMRNIETDYVKKPEYIKAIVDMIKVLPPRKSEPSKPGILLSELDDLRSIYAGELGEKILQNQGTTLEPDYTWYKITMAIVATKELVVTAKMADFPARIRDLLDWCALVFRTWHVDDWIKKNGGWENLPSQCPEYVDADTPASPDADSDATASPSP